MNQSFTVNREKYPDASNDGDLACGYAINSEDDFCKQVRAKMITMQLQNLQRILFSIEVAWETPPPSTPLRTLRLHCPHTPCQALSPHSLDDALLDVDIGVDDLVLIHHLASLDEQAVLGTLQRTHVQPSANRQSALEEQRNRRSRRDSASPSRCGTGDAAEIVKKTRRNERSSFLSCCLRGLVLAGGR